MNAKTLLTAPSNAITWKAYAEDDAIFRAFPYGSPQPEDGERQVVLLLCVYARKGRGCHVFLKSHDQPVARLWLPFWHQMFDQLIRARRGSCHGMRFRKGKRDCVSMEYLFACPE
jgi:hypothetical protein